MKKSKVYLLLLLIIQSCCLFAEDSDRPSCDKAKALEVLNAPQIKPLQAIQANFAQYACKETHLFADIKDSHFRVNHDKLHCNQVELCLGAKKDEEKIKDAKVLIKENLPKAALLAVLANEIDEVFEFNLQLNRFETEHNVVLCPEEKIEPSCDKDIRNALSSVVNTFIDFRELDSAPLSTDKLHEFVARKFFTGDEYKEEKINKTNLQANCTKKISFMRICHNRDIRLKKISECEKDSKLNSCLDDEQKALASIFNDQKSNQELYLALEKELCLANRITHDTKESTADKIGQNRLKHFMTTSHPITGLKTRPESRRKWSMTGEALPINISDNSTIVGVESLDMGPPVPPVPADPVGEVGSIDGNNTPENLVSDKSIPEGGLSINGNPSATVNSNFGNHFGPTLDDENIAQDEVENKKINDQEMIKKKDELSTLLAQINRVQARLDEMTQKVDSLKNKIEEDPSTEKPTDKELADKEKLILDLKKKLSDMEIDKRKREIEIARMTEVERMRARDEMMRNSSTKITSAAIRDRDNPQADFSSREAEKSSSNQLNSQVNINSSLSGDIERSPAAISSSSSGVLGQEIVLKVAGTQATSESNVVFMTSGDLQKYPYHLGVDAAEVEIEKMLIKNNGAAIIIGESEQIIPLIDNGVVQLDRDGKVKYKRVKITLVKNDKDLKKNIAREISSVADLKREEQKTRDLIRYQEMKNAVKLDK